MARCWARWVAAVVGRSRTSNARRPGSAQAELSQRLVDRPRPPEVAAVQDKLDGRPWRQVGLVGKFRKVRAIPWPGARQRQVRLEWPAIRLQPRPHALGLNPSCELAGLIGARANLEPDDADEPPALESSDIAPRKLEGG